MPNSLFRKKSIDNILRENEQSQGHPGGLKKVLGVRDLTFLGIAAVVGAGIFSTIGSAAFNGGPGISILFVITAITCGFSALCYAEFASRVPVAGSAYTYSYVTFGEIIAWIIGWLVFFVRLAAFESPTPLDYLTMVGITVGPPGAAGLIGWVMKGFRAQ